MTSTPTWCLENRGSFASIHVILPPNTKVNCETDAVVTFSGPGVQVSGAMSGGFWGSLFRVFFGGESFYTTLVENAGYESPGDVMMAPSDPGGVELHQLLSNNNDDLLMMAGAYVASDVTVSIGTELQSKIRNSLLSGTGFFLLRASGKGTVAIAAYGSIHKYVLKVGETRAVDNGHLVAWTANTNYRVGLANPRGGILTSMKSGEGLMCHFTGPGTVYLQSHKPSPEAETAIKHGKNTAKGAVQATVGAYIFVGFILIIIVVIAVVAITNGGEININTNNDYYDNNQQSSYQRRQYSSSSSSSRSRHGSGHGSGYRSLGEF